MVSLVERNVDQVGAAHVPGLAAGQVLRLDAHADLQ